MLSVVGDIGRGPTRRASQIGRYQRGRRPQGARVSDQLPAKAIPLQDELRPTGAKGAIPIEHNDQAIVREFRNRRIPSVAVWLQGPHIQCLRMSHRATAPRQVIHFAFATRCQTPHVSVAMPRSEAELITMQDSPQRGPHAQTPGAGLPRAQRFLLRSS